MYSDEETSPQIVKVALEEMDLGLDLEDGIREHPRDYA